MRLHSILLVGDDGAFATMLAQQLSFTKEFEPVVAATAMEALAIVRRMPLDAILIDGELPDLDSRELCRHLRRGGIRAPLLIVGETASDADVILALEAGADDFVAKPVRFPVLLERVRARLRQNEAPDAAVFPVGRLTYDAASRQLVSADGHRRIGLTRKEAEILKLLCRERGRAIERSTLLREIWGLEDGATRHSLETHIYRLRQKIETDQREAQLILTEGNGYRLR
jgi:DNA-binding response OmpR family regulator